MGSLYSKLKRSREQAQIDSIEGLRIALLVYDGYFFAKYSDILTARGDIDSGPDTSYQAAVKLWDMGVRTKIVRSLTFPDYGRATRRCKWLRVALSLDNCHLSKDDFWT